MPRQVDIYYAEGPQVYVNNLEIGRPELFLTVHPTTCPMKPEEQSHLIADVLNDLFKEARNVQ